MQTIKLTFLVLLAHNVFGQKKFTDTLNFSDGKPERTSFYKSYAKEWTVINYHITNNIRSIVHYDSTGVDLTGRNNYFDLQGELIAFIEFDKGLLHGDYREYYLNGNLKSKGQMLKSCRNGEWVTYYPNGKIQSISYYEAFSFEKLEDLDKSSINSLNISYCEREDVGEQGLIFKKYDLKKLHLKCAEILFCVDGKKVGTWITYDESGKVKTKHKY